jgi:nicotinamide-nucleotide amidase
MHRTAAILSIGDELTLGQTLDTNSRWLSDQLLSRGIITLEHATVPDDQTAITEAFKRLAANADLVISTGGLGPTADDLTREGLAGALGDSLIEDSQALKEITSYFAARRTPMRDINKTQARRPSLASILSNPNGTAPGLAAKMDLQGRQTDFFCLPGPPREMRPMFEAHALPRLQLDPHRSITTRALHTFGLGESEIATRLGPLMDRDRNPTVGTTASNAIVSCRIRFESKGAGAPTPPSTGATRSITQEVLDTESHIRAALGPYIFGADSDTLPSVILDTLRSRREQLATVESCTGGMLGALLTDVPGSSEAYVGGWVTYTNELKTSQVGVPESHFAPGGPGAVSRETAEAMATGGLDRSGAEHCLAITGIAGPGGGTPEKPVGTVWIARASRGLLASTSGGAVPHRIESRKLFISAERAVVRDYSAKAALAMLRFYLIGEPDLKLMREVPVH